MDDHSGSGLTHHNEYRAPLNLDTQKDLGAFYTCPDAAEQMAAWALQRPGMRILEPSFGSGIFLRAARRVAAKRFNGDMSIVAAELSPQEYARAKESIDPRKDVLHLGDFLQMPLTQVDAVIGNPPYVRLRNLPASQALAAQDAAAKSLGSPMETSGSLWMPFVLRCMDFLNRGGKMALVLPFELTYVRYARPLWRKLSEHFSSLSIVRVRERLFPDLLQDVVILYADDFGGSTVSVEFQIQETLSDFICGTIRPPSVLSADSLARGNRDFIRAHLDPCLQQLIDTKLHQLTEPVSKQCTFNIGYVSGHKAFFHPDNREQESWSLPERSLVDSLVSGRSMKGAGLFTSQLGPDRLGKLFLPVTTRLTKGERAYIQHGEAQGVDSRYKCRVRSPWYIVPGVRVSDLILSVFAERPILMRNDLEIVTTNSLLAGLMKSGYSADAFVTAWYSSLTLLGCEMQVHSLGGGVLVLIPGEVGKIRIPLPIKTSRTYLRQLNSALLDGNLRLAYELGDEYVLRGILGLSSSEIDMIREGASYLARWRQVTRNL